MKNQAYIQSSESHFSDASKFRLKATDNDQHHSQSSKPRVIRLPQYHRKQFLDTKNTTQSTAYSNITVRSVKKTISSPNNQLANSKHDLYSVSTIRSTRHHQNELNKLFAIQKKNIIHPTVYHKTEQSSKTLSAVTMNSSELFERTVHIESINSTKTGDGWPDRANLDDKHHRSVKKKNKKKYLRLCKIISILVVLLLVIVTAMLLPILLTRSKTITTTNKTAVLRWNSTGITIAGITGQFGNASNQLNAPFGLALDWSNTLYIADWSNNRVQKFMTNSSFGVTVAGQAIGSWNTTSNYLHYDGDVAVDSNGNVYVADTFNNRIQFWASGSSSGVTVAGTGSTGNSSNQLYQPYGFTRDPNSGTLYISDTSNNRVMSFLSGASSGSIVAVGNGGGISSTQVFNPAGLYFDSLSNSLIIANGGANNVIRWVFGASSWTLVAGNINGSIGNTSTGLSEPMDVTLDPMGNIYVADRNNHRIQFFMGDQTNGITIAGITGISGNNSTMLNSPFSVALDSQLNLYVSDTFNSRVQKFLRY